MIWHKAKLSTGWLLAKMNSLLDENLTKLNLLLDEYSYFSLAEPCIGWLLI